MQQWKDSISGISQSNYDKIVDELNEPELNDNYPVYYGYVYIADGKIIQSPIEGNVKRLKLYLNASKIQRCDIVKRGLISK